MLKSPDELEYKLSIKAVTELSSTELMVCRELTFGNRGKMRSRLDFGVRHKNEDYQVILVKNSTQMVVGWALIFPMKYYHDGECREMETVYFFVDIFYRHKGIGNRLVEKVLAKTSDPIFHPHDETSARFFQNYKDEFFCVSYRKHWMDCF